MIPSASNVVEREDQEIDEWASEWNVNVDEMSRSDARARRGHG
jgi:hypothetical protein